MMGDGEEEQAQTTLTTTATTATETSPTATPTTTPTETWTCQACYENGTSRITIDALNTLEPDDNVEEDIVVELPCGHQFHVKCLYAAYLGAKTTAYSVPSDNKARCCGVSWCRQPYPRIPRAKRPHPDLPRIKHMEGFFEKVKRLKRCSEKESVSIADEEWATMSAGTVVCLKRAKRKGWYAAFVCLKGKSVVLTDGVDRDGKVLDSEGWVEGNRTVRRGKWERVVV